MRPRPERAATARARGLVVRRAWPTRTLRLRSTEAPHPIGARAPPRVCDGLDRNRVLEECALACSHPPEFNPLRSPTAGAGWGLSGQNPTPPSAAYSPIVRKETPTVPSLVFVLVEPRSPGNIGAVCRAA